MACTVQQALWNRDVMMVELYRRLLTVIISRLNLALSPGNQNNYVLVFSLSFSSVHVKVPHICLCFSFFLSFVSLPPSPYFARHAIELQVSAFPFILTFHPCSCLYPSFPPPLCLRLCLSLFSSLSFCLFPFVSISLSLPLQPHLLFPPLYVLVFFQQL